MNDPIQLTPEQQKDFNERVEAFQKRLVDLQTELFIKFVVFPQWIPTQHGYTTIADVGFKDTKYTPQPSPYGGIIKEK